MYKNFLKPIKIIFVVYILGGLSIASDVAQLTSINILNLLRNNSPQSYYILIIGTMILYTILVIKESIYNKPTQQTTVPEYNFGQFVVTHDVKKPIMKQFSRNDYMKGNEATEDDKVRKNSFFDHQSIFAENITDSTIIQFIEKHYRADPLVDQKINEGVEIVRKSRFFTDFDTTQASLNLVKKLINGELSNGSDAVKSRAMAWCSRLLSRMELEKAEEYLKLARELGNCPEIEIAEAFICSQRGDKCIALSILGNLNLPLSRTAALIIVAHHEGPQKAIDWLETIGCSATELDSDGKYILLTLHLQFSQWGAAQLYVDALTDDDLCITPALHQIAAITHLISAVPDELRTEVLNQVPFEAASFPLAADATAIEARQKAQHYFITATQIAQKLGCYGSAKLFDEFALWLELRDPNQSEQGIRRLKEKLRDPKSALHLVRFGLQFGIKLDLELVEKEIERQIALHGGITQDAAITRFAIAFTYKNPEDIVNYITRHRDELAKYFNKKSLQFLEIEMLSRAKMPEKAKQCLDILIAEGLSEAEEKRLQRIIAEVEGINPIESCKEQFRKTDTLDDLIILVEKLEERGEWDELCDYGKILFSRTRSLHDAELLARALSNAKKNKQLVEFLKFYQILLSQSKKLRMTYCWALYNEGALLEARSELSRLVDNRDNPNYRALQVNLGIALGDWNSLTTFVANEYLEKDKRSAHELISTAQLAHYLGSPYAKKLTILAAEKGNNDAGVLVTAYFLASSAGWEGEKEAFQWFKKAVELSGNDGPMQRKSLKDILDMKPDWDRLESETLQLLSRGDIPMFLAGESLNRSLIHMMLFPALTNLSENDPRRRGIIPAYSGKRQLTSLKSLGVVAIDATVLLTLSLLKLLDKALEAFETVYIPHSTLNWLFEEKQKASFHQPSRIRDAYQLHRLLTMDSIEKLNSSTVPNSDLSAQVGNELAVLIAEATNTSEGGTKCIVVRPYPVYRIASLIEEEVDLTEYASILSSCQAIVSKLRSNGQITVEEEKKACAYLELHEKPWPNQPEIADRAILYLDDLATTYFLHLGLLEKLKAAGFRTIVSPRKLSEANELTSYECISDQINDAIEQIRSTLNVRLESGRIKVGRKSIIDKLEKQSISKYPTVNLLALANECEAIFADDRFLNQHFNINIENTQTPIFSTLDLLDMLVSIGSISNVDLLECKTLLRRAGYFLIPVSDYELVHHLNASAVKDNKVIENAELKAIRENILCARMSTWLQLPKETPWLNTILHTFIQVLKGLWINETDVSSIRARSNWILDQIDIHGWAHCFGTEAGDNIIKTGYGAYILMMLMPPTDASQKNKDEYWNWIEDMVLDPIKEQHPDLYSWIVEWLRKEFAVITNTDLYAEGKND